MMDAVGWISAMFLLLTVSARIVAQWRSGSTKGVSHWMFVGQLVTSTGFVVHSASVDNGMFVIANAATLYAALMGQPLYLRNRRRPPAAGGA